MSKSLHERAWYVSSTGNHQCLVIDESTGRNVAVIYDASDAHLIAATPKMINVLNTIARGNTDPDTMVQMAQDVLRQTETSGFPLVD